jgi:hypothetical protein
MCITRTTTGGQVKTQCLALTVEYGVPVEQRIHPGDAEEPHRRQVEVDHANADLSDDPIPDRSGIGHVDLTGDPQIGPIAASRP